MFDATLILYRDPQFPVMLSFLSELKTGTVDGVKVRLGRLQNLLSTSCVEHLDFLHNAGFPTEEVSTFKQVKSEHIGFQSLTDIPTQKPIVEEQKDFVVRTPSVFLEYVNDEFICRRSLRTSRATRYLWPSPRSPIHTFTGASSSWASYSTGRAETTWSGTCRVSSRFPHVLSNSHNTYYWNLCDRVMLRTYDSGTRKIMASIS